jgi:hypothetical protein
MAEISRACGIEDGAPVDSDDTIGVVSLRGRASGRCGVARSARPGDWRPSDATSSEGTDV